MLLQKHRDRKIPETTWLEIIFIIPSLHVQITFQKHEGIIHVINKFVENKPNSYLVNIFLSFF